MIITFFPKGEMKSAHHFDQNDALISFLKGVSNGGKTSLNC